MIALFALALAQDDTDAIPVSEEIIVYRKLRAEQARDEVITDLKDLGYTRVIEKGDATVLRHESAWKGEVWLHDDGWMRIRRQPVQFEAPKTPWGKRNSAGSWLGCVLYPFACVRPGGQLVGKRKFQAVETRTAFEVDPEVASWSNRVADLAVEERATELPDRLQALWDEGIPLEGDGTLTSVEARKAALLGYWETRTETEWGETIRATVESFIRGVVQHSDDPFTSAEIRRFNRQSRAGRALSLERRVADE